VTSTPISLMPPARTPNLRVVAVFLLVAVTIGGTVWFLQTREFRGIHDVMERNEVEFERVDPDDVAGMATLDPGEAEQLAMGTYGAARFPHSKPYLGRFSAPHLGRGIEDELVYTIRLKGWSPGPVIEGDDGEPQEFVVILPARPRGTDGGWSVSLPTQPPYLTPETMR
jgi:hypothetical protein